VRAGVCPGDEADRAGAEAEERDGGQRLGGRVADRGRQAGRERQRHQRAERHRPRGQLQALVAAQQRLLADEERRLGDGGAEHEQRALVEREPAVPGQRDQRGARARDRDARPAQRRHALGEQHARGDRGEHRRRVDEQRRRPGGHRLLARVEQELVGGHPGEPDRRDRGEVAPRGEPHAARGGDRAERGGGDEQPQNAQVRGAEVLQGRADRRERGAPQHDRGGEGGGGAKRHGSHGRTGAPTAQVTVATAWRKLR
jgi:hypothetical protein